MEFKEYGFIKDEKVFLKGFLEFPDREIGEVKGSEEESLKYFVDRFEVIEKKVTDLVLLIETSVNKGSFLMKLIHLREQIKGFDAIGDYIPLLDKLNLHETQIRELIASNRLKNLEIKKMLLLELQAAATQVPDWKQASELIKDIRQRWLKTGSVEKEYSEELENQYNTISDDFFTRRTEFFENRKKNNEEAVSKYEALILETEEATTQYSNSELADKLKELQVKWKALPSLPSKQRNSFWQKFRKINDDAFTQLKTERTEKRSEEFKGVLEELVGKAEVLRSESDDESIKKVQELQKHWRYGVKILKGKVDPELSDRFHLACDSVFERNFVEKLSRSKNKDFAKKDELDQNKIRLKILRDLHNRDKSELDLFLENSEKFHGSGTGFNEMIKGKKQLKERKLKVKKFLIDEIKEIVYPKK